MAGDVFAMLDQLVAHHLFQARRAVAQPGLQGRQRITGLSERPARLRDSPSFDVQIPLGIGNPDAMGLKRAPNG